MEDVYAQQQLCEMVRDLYEMSGVEKRVVDPPGTPTNSPRGETERKRRADFGEVATKRRNGGSTFSVTEFSIFVRAR